MIKAYVLENDNGFLEKPDNPLVSNRIKKSIQSVLFMQLESLLLRTATSGVGSNFKE